MGYVVWGTGIDQSDLVVLESHVTYSTSKEKTAAYFYIMQLTKADNSIALQIPIKNTINRSFSFFSFYPITTQQYIRHLFFLFSVKAAC